MDLEKLSLITDEISQDFDKVLGIAKQYGLKKVEVRMVWGKNIALFTDENIQKMKDSLKLHDMGISMISGPFGKCFLPSSRFAKHDKKSFARNPEYNLSHFNRLLDIANQLGTKFIRIFNFFKSSRKVREKDWAEMKSLLLPYIKRAEKEGFILMLENEHVCFADNIANTKRFLSEIQSPAIKLNLDPGNFFSAKEKTTPETFEWFYKHDLVGYMHIKDPIRRLPMIGGIFGIVGQGKINYKDLIHQAIDSGFDGFFSLETHCLKNKEENSVKSLDYLRNILSSIHI